jgi:GNAT superfamily N-acetyltransferase
MSDRITIRHDVGPGDLGAVTTLQATEYNAQYGLGRKFETDVARGLADFGDALSADPGAGRMWLAEDGDDLIGSMMVTRESDTLARLRFFLIVRAARGKGLGHRLLDISLDYARECGFRKVELVTFSKLQAAAHLYSQAGFELCHSEPSTRWGPEVELRRYELTL